MKKAVLATAALICSVTAEISEKSLNYFHDGANRRTVSIDQLGFSERWGFLTGTDPIILEELIPIRLHHYQDSLFSLTVSATVGSELYDPLLNKYDQPQLANSDHRSYLSGRAIFPSIGTSFDVRYRYEDRFSQNFDRYTQGYEQYRKKALPLSGYGLAEDKSFEIVHAGKSTAAGISIQNFDRWGVVPFYDSVYAYRTGTHVRGVGQFYRKRVTLRAGFGTRVYDVTPVIDSNLSSVITISTKSNKQHEIEFLGSGSFKINSQWELSAGTDCGVELYQDPRVFSSIRQTGSRGFWQLTGDVSLKNGSLDGEIHGDLSLSEQISVRGEIGGKSNLSGEQQEAWKTATKVIQFVGESSSELCQTGSIRYTTSNVLPTEFQVIAIANQRPRYETRFQGLLGDSIVVATEHDKAQFAIGSTGSVTFDRTLVGVHVLGMIRGDLLSKPALSTPGFLTTEVRIGKSGQRDLHGLLSLENRAPVTRTRFESDGSELTDKSSWNNSMSVQIIAPVVAPFLRDNLLPSLIMSAGPIQLAKNQSVEQLPNGNLISPEISITISATVKKRSNQ